MPSTSELSEHRHAVVLDSHELNPSILSTSVDLANSESILRCVVHAGLNWTTGQLVIDGRTKLCSERWRAMPLLVGQANVGNLLLWSRKPASAREVLLFREEVQLECDGTNYTGLLSVQIKDSTNRRDVSKS